jgi:2-dehydropantoate 2-reductase
VLFCVKLTDTEAAAQALLPVVKAGAHIFTFQNGVESAERLDGIFGSGRTVSGIAYISAVLSSPGHVIHTSQIPRLQFGERDGAPSARVQTLLRACQTAGVEAIAVPNITRAVWEKFVRLAPLASITALTRAPIGQLRTEPRSRRLLQLLVEEAVTVGVAKKTGLVPGEVELVMKSVDGLDGSMRASMAFDIENGKPLESRYLSGAVVRIGEEVGLPTPVHRFFYDALAVWENGAAK